MSLSDGTQYASTQATIWRWRDAIQDEFAARMQWTLNRSISEVSHRPMVTVNGSTGPDPLELQLGANESLILDAGKTCDSDHPGDLSQLEFEWFGYPLPAGFNPQQALSIRPLAPTPGTEGIIALNEGGLSNVTLGTKVAVSLTTDNGPLVDGQSWTLILQVRTTGPYPIRRYKRFTIKTLL